eukprot:TRINITY_DN85913_c0_g1_i1.p1 TRINITY_DN85913_c0_g1~~TRINITY_DN85913_c0_g1_i1.p1  ORF type:complete len:274 (+),score=19.71 TRINITY_DN85913_c0_g1_i1:83-823(+)
MKEWKEHGTGPLAYPGHASFGFINTGLNPALQQRGIPDIEIFQGNVGFAEGLWSGLIGYKPEYQPIDRSDLNADGMVMGAVLTRPESIGKISLTGNDIHSRPAIDPNYMSVDHDVKTLAAGMKFILQLVNENTTLWNSVLEKFIDLPNPHPKFSEPWFEHYARAYTINIHHPVGTCRMGPVAQDGSVVSAVSLKVIGMKNLRVVDSSICPFVPSGHTQAVAMMIAEKAAAQIKAQYLSEKCSAGSY